MSALHEALLDKDPPQYFLTGGELSDVMYNLDLRGRRISFALDAVDPKARDWLCETLTRQILEADQRAEEQTREQFQLAAQQLFGLPTGGRL